MFREKYPISQFPSSLTPRTGHEQRIRIDRILAIDVDTIMQMRRRAFGIAGIADIADDIAAVNEFVLFDRPEAVQMGKVMDLEPRAQYSDVIAAEAVLPYADDQAPNGRKNGCAAFGENVDAPVLTIAAARTAPGVNDRLA